jgi:hypothetical protein
LIYASRQVLVAAPVLGWLLGFVGCLIPLFGVLASAVVVGVGMLLLGFF